MSEEQKQDNGAPASPSGSRASHEAPTGLHPSGFDPSREIVHRIASVIDYPSVYMGGPRRDSIRKALAVLMALREPTVAMLEAAKPEPTHLYGEGERGEEYQRQMRAACEVDRLAARQVWQDMIDVGLAYRDSDRNPKGGDAKQAPSRQR